MEFKQLLGTRIYLELPKQEEESKIVVDENTKEALQKELIKKMSKLKVYAVGDGVFTIKQDDVVLIHPEALSKAPIIPLDNEKNVLLVSIFDVIHVW